MSETASKEIHFFMCVVRYIDLLFFLLLENIRFPPHPKLIQLVLYAGHMVRMYPCYSACQVQMGEDLLLLISSTSQSFLNL